MSQININNEPSAEVIIDENGTPVTVIIATSGASGAVWGSITGTLSDQTDLQNALDAKVPYSGATGNVNLGEYGLTSGYVQFDITPTTYTAAVGNMGWNDSEGTIDLLLKGGVVSLPLGQKQVARVVNGTGGNVLKSNYQVVKVTGAQGQRLQVNLAQANNDANSADTLGLIAENINNNNSGFIITSGLIENINTTGSLQGETWADGNILYLSPTVAGRVTNVKPQAPQHTVIVGFVVYAHANNGKIYVKVDNGYELDELHNVRINTGTLVNGQVLKYNSSLQVWENNTDSAGVSGSGTQDYVAKFTTTGSTVGDSIIRVSGTDATYFSTYKGANSDGNNIFIGGGGQSSIGAIGETYKGSANVSLGLNALTYNTTGFYNTAVGTSSLDNNTSGNSNSAFGLNSLKFNTTGTSNSAVGFNSLYSNTTGYVNTALGSLALYSNTTGYRNSAVGDNALYYNNTGYRNSAVGGGALYYNTTGHSNSALGYESGFGTGSNANTTGSNNIFIGYQSVGVSSTESNRTWIGNSSTTSTWLGGNLLLGTTTDVGTSILTMSSTSKGFLRPRMTTVQRDAIVSPATGLSIYNTTTNKVNYYNGTAWTEIQDTITNPVTGTGVSGQVSYWSGPNTQAGSNNLFWDNTNGRLGIGTNSTSDNAQLKINSGSGADNLLLEKYGDTSLLALRTALGTISSPTAVIDQTSIGQIGFRAHTGSGFSGSRALINAVASQNWTVSANGVNLGFFTTPNGSTTRSENLRIWNNGNISIQNGGTFTDNGARLQVNGISSFTGTTASDGGQLGSELLSASGWTSTGWTGSFGAGYTHTVGNTSVLSNPLTASSSLVYQIQYTITGRTAGTISIAFGGQTLTNISATGTQYIYATTSGTVAITPTSDFDGTIIPSIRAVSKGSATVQLRNSGGTLVNEVRTSNSNTNTYIGVDAGSRSLTATDSVAIGVFSLQSNVNGTNSVAIGRSALQNSATSFNTIAIGSNALANYLGGTFGVAIGHQAGSNSTGGGANVYIGTNAGQNSTTSTFNVLIGHTSGQAITSNGQIVSIGNQAGLNNNTGGNWTAIGCDAARYYSGGTTSATSFSNGIYLGHTTKVGAAGATNEVVIGYQSEGLGSNTTVIGNSSTTFGRWWGNLLVGSSVNGGQALQVTGDAFITSHVLLNTTLPSRHTQTIGFKAFWPGADSSFMASTASGFEGWLLNANVVRLGGNWVNQDTTRPSWSVGALHGSSADSFFIQRSPATSGTSALVELFKIIGSNGNVIIGTGADNGAKLQLTGSTTASSGVARGQNITSTLVASANNDVLVGLDINPTFTNGAFTGVVNTALRIQNGNLNIVDRDVVLSTTTGTKIGTATSQKLAFWNATPIVQPTTGVASATRVGGAGTTVTDTDTFDGYTLAQIVKALRNTGILA